MIKNNSIKTESEFALVIKKLKLNLPDDEIKEICRKIDQNQDNKISLAGKIFYNLFYFEKFKLIAKSLFYLRV